MPQGSAIPFDILEDIIDILAADDDKNSTFLKPCALICRSLLHRSRRHIFRTITVGLPTDLTEKQPKLFPQMPSRLCRLMSHTPVIADYVRVLKIGVGSGEKYYAESRKLPATLRQFKHIESLMLSARCAPRNEGIKLLDWTNVRPSLQHSILSLIQLGTLKSLILWKLIFPIFQVKLGVNVRALRIADVDFFERDDQGPQAGPEPQNTVQPIQLHDYCMANNCGAQSAVLLEATRPNGRPIFDFSHLRCLVAEWHLPGDFDVLQNITNKTTHLTTLCLTIKSYTATTSLGVFLGGLSDMTLKTLKKITIYRQVASEWDDTPMADLTDGLETMSRFPNVLEQLVYCEQLLAEHLQHNLGAELEKLDATLGSCKWPCLNTVSLGFTILYRGGPASARQVEAALRQKHFPVLNAREKVSLSIEIFDDR
ncbi:hypothetical protein HYPSUDRAFT_47380 [Hypholoma sublateritium FD-334 SS-4]|uniref:F-box domain-containing protein n=1 Tax=Hypholoma sublateritium (strain FD-334 SS-4) TaxID=945553 RepID=A0A0D2NIM3_HYPSF|nr:hypothetical protein HYPSUDRAFT_47380 [Hypholoma sublateritium FD-334 SS-4]